MNTTDPTSPAYILHGRLGWGSALIEAQLDTYGLPWRLQDCGHLFEDEAARERLKPLNPLAQVPILVTPSGQVLCESAAITLHLADLTGSQALVPGPQAPERAGFLRWLVFLVANIYPTFTYADDPRRFVADAEAAKGFDEAVSAYQRRLWTLVEGEVKGPYFLGERFSALDIYLAVMTHWRPRKAWFTENTPLIAQAANRASAQPAVAAMLARNFKAPQTA